MRTSDSNWDWGPAWRRLRDDVNLLAWLFEEERVKQRLYLEFALWAITGVRFGVDEFAREVGLGGSADKAPDDTKLSAEGPLGSGGES